MARLVFTQNLQRHVSCPPGDHPGATVRDVLEHAFAANAAARGYVLDDRGALRRHMLVFVDDQPIRDRVGLTDAVGPRAEVYVMQALSGG